VKFHKMRNFTGDDDEAANHVSAPPGVGDPDDQNAGHRSQPIADPDVGSDGDAASEPPLERAVGHHIGTTIHSPTAGAMTNALANSTDSGRCRRLTKFVLLLWTRPRSSDGAWVAATTLTTTTRTA
jgi:hypothetical protein